MQSNNFYVYCYINYDWRTIFYIGKGSGSRYKDVKRRSSHFKAIVQIVISDGLSEEKACYIERTLKKYLKSKGFPIIDYEANVRQALQREGIERAKALNKYAGGKKKCIENIREYYNDWKSGLCTKTALAQRLHISRPTLNRIFNDFESTNKGNLL